MTDEHKKRLQEALEFADSRADVILTNINLRAESEGGLASTWHSELVFMIEQIAHDCRAIQRAVAYAAEGEDLVEDEKNSNDPA